jgi:hypothetical protein
MRRGTRKRKLEVVVQRDWQNDEQQSSFLRLAFLIGNLARLHTMLARDIVQAALKKLCNLKTEDL